MAVIAAANTLSITKEKTKKVFAIDANQLLRGCIIGTMCLDVRERYETRRNWLEIEEA